jgi:hypothetical protein
VFAYFAGMRMNSGLICRADHRHKCKQTGFRGLGIAWAVPSIKEDPMSHHLTTAIRDCLAACDSCAEACGNCFAHMVGEASNNDCPRCCVECAAICRLCADAMARNSPFMKELCELCARICTWCADQCNAHEMAHCRACAEACRRCAAACRAI